MAIHGAAGRMGRRLLDMTLGADDLELVAAIDKFEVGMDSGTLAGREPSGVLVADDWTGVECDVIVDFSTAAAVAAVAEAARAHKASLVVCTTGMDEPTMQTLREVAHDTAVLVSPNMALGVNLMFALVEQVARAIGADCDIELLEMHHRHKEDAPSGTAMRIAERVAAGLGKPLDDIAIYGRQGRYDGGRPRGEFAIHTLRGGDVVGDHSTVFAADGERLEITHRATSRDVFAAGALRAARWLANRPAGWYAMRDVLGLPD